MKIYKIKVNGKTYKVELEAVDEVASEAVKEEKKAEEKKPAAAVASSGEGQKVTSPIQGSVVNVKVKPGDRVKKGQVIAYMTNNKQSKRSILYFSIRKHGKCYDPEKVIATKISN